mgnify:CR=1 FL=1
MGLRILNNINNINNYHLQLLINITNNYASYLRSSCIIVWEKRCNYSSFRPFISSFWFILQRSAPLPHTHLLPNLPCSALLAHRPPIPVCQATGSQEETELCLPQFIARLWLAAGPSLQCVKVWLLQYDIITVASSLGSGFRHSPVNFFTNSHPYVRTPAHSRAHARNPALVRAHSRSGEHNPTSAAYWWENDKN